VTLFISNISYTASEKDLRGFLADAGCAAQKLSLVRDGEGRSRGFAFVEMADRTAGELAIKRLHGREFQGRDLVVQESKRSATRGQRKTEAANG